MPVQTYTTFLITASACSAECHHLQALPPLPNLLQTESTCEETPSPLPWLRRWRRSCPTPSAVLYVANCELAVELVYDDIGDSGACVVVCLRELIAKDTARGVYQLPLVWFREPTAAMAVEPLWPPLRARPRRRRRRRRLARVQVAIPIGKRSADFNDRDFASAC